MGEAETGTHVRSSRAFLALESDGLAIEWEIKKENSLPNPFS